MAAGAGGRRTHDAFKRAGIKDVTLKLYPGLRHEILNRRTLALGAVIAAEFLNGKRGVYTMDDLLK